MELINVRQANVRLRPLLIRFHLEFNVLSIYDETNIYFLIKKMTLKISKLTKN